MVTLKKIPWFDEVAALGDTAPQIVQVQTASGGVGATASRIDHKHDLSVGSPVALDGNAGDGTGTAAARNDHKHALGPLAVLLDFNKKEAQNLVFHNAATITTPVKGQVYYDTDDDHLYVCTVA
jgi:hypothetical protein